MYLRIAVILTNFQQCTILLENCEKRAILRYSGKIPKFQIPQGVQGKWDIQSIYYEGNLESMYLKSEVSVLKGSEWFGLLTV